MDGCDAFVGFAGCDEFGDRLAATAGGEGGLAEAVVGVEPDRDGAAEGVEAASAAAAVVVEVDASEECPGGVGEL